MSLPLRYASPRPMQTSPTAPRAWLLTIAVALSSGCGAAEDGLTWVQSLWSDPVVAEEPPVDGPLEPPAVPDVAGGTGGSTGPTQAMGSTSAGTGSGTSTGDGGTSGGSTTIPMSFARPMTGSDGSGSDGSGSGSGGSGSGSEDTGGTTDASGESGTTGAEAVGGTTGGATAPSLGPPPACLEGEWAIDDFSTYYRRVIRAQAHGRAVRSLGTSGRYTLRFGGSDLHGEAKRLRMRYSARLADQDIEYSVDINGTFDTTVTLEGSDTLVVRTVAGATIRARETARFPGGKTEKRRPTLPVFGRFEFTCTPKTLELRPVVKGRTKDTIRFVRPGSGGP